MCALEFFEKQSKTSKSAKKHQKVPKSTKKRQKALKHTKKHLQSTRKHQKAPFQANWKVIFGAFG